MVSKCGDRRQKGGHHAQNCIKNDPRDTPNCKKCARLGVYLGPPSRIHPPEGQRKPAQGGPEGCGTVTIKKTEAGLFSSRGYPGGRYGDNREDRNRGKTSQWGFRWGRHGDNREDRNRGYAAQGVLGCGTVTIEKAEAEAIQLRGGAQRGGTATIEKAEAEAKQLKG